MASVTIKAELLDVVQVRNAPDKMTVLVRQEMRRHAKRFRKNFVKQLKVIDFEKGPIGQMVRSKIIGEGMTSFFSGNTVDAFKIVSRASPFLASYILGDIVQGLPVPFKSVGKLYLREPEKITTIPWDRTKKRGPLTDAEKKRTVKISSKLEFKALWEALEPSLLIRIEKAIKRALATSFVLRSAKKHGG